MNTLKDIIRTAARIEVEAFDEEKMIEDHIKNHEISGKILGDLLTNSWAWCQIRVSAHWHGIATCDYLHACSYKSKEDFIENSGYYDDMVNECIDQLEKYALEVWHDCELCKEFVDRNAKSL